jgi:hypothetical protein
MHIATARDKGIRSEGAIFHVLCIRRLSTRMSIIAAKAATKLKIVNTMEAMEVPPNKFWTVLGELVLGIGPVVLNMVLVADI